MRVLVAPDKFAGTLTAKEAAECIRTGWLRARPRDLVEAVPLADGGEGTIDVVAAAVPKAQINEVVVPNAQAEPVVARWLLLPDGRALIESAQACGLSNLSRAERDPRNATTLGVGLLIEEARRREASQIIVGIGGTATVDGGGGMASALGNRLLRADGTQISRGGSGLAELVTIEASSDFGTPVVAAADVTAPLLGPHGAARAFARQKGASMAVVRDLERNLIHFADIAERELPGGPWRACPGAGAGGGLGFALLAFLRASVASGAELVAELVGFRPLGADLIVTGEGRLDGQSGNGKVPDFVRRICHGEGISVAAIVGQVSSDAESGFDALSVLGPDGLSRPHELLRLKAEELARHFN